MLARAAARHKEIAVRKALGASRARLIRQLLTECVLLSTAGAVLGVVFARWGSALLVRYISTKSDTIFLDLTFDWRILSFTAAVALLTGLLFGVLPALRSTRVSLTSAMKGSQTGDAESRTKFRPGKWIVAMQVALSLVLLMASGLFLRSLVKLVTMDVGFDQKQCADRARGFAHCESCARAAARDVRRYREQIAHSSRRSFRRPVCHHSGQQPDMEQCAASGHSESADGRRCGRILQLHLDLAILRPCVHRCWRGRNFNEQRHKDIGSGGHRQ